MIMFSLCLQSNRYLDTQFKEKEEAVCSIDRQIGATQTHSLSLLGKIPLFREVGILFRNPIYILVMLALTTT